MDEDPEPSGQPPMLPEVVQVVGAPGAGKSLLVTLLTEALIARDIRPATAEHDADEGRGTTVIGIASGGRITAERVLPVQELRRLVAQLDPQAAIVLAERYVEVGIPVIAIGDPPTNLTNAVIERIEPGTVIEWWERGPESAAPLAELIERIVIGRTPEETFALSAATRGSAAARGSAATRGSQRRRGILGWLAATRWAGDRPDRPPPDEQTD